jgi:hypothetical protein
MSALPPKADIGRDGELLCERMPQTASETVSEMASPTHALSFTKGCLTTLRQKRSIFGSLPSGSRRLLERDLGKAPQLARMQPFSFLGLELFQGSKTDLKMMADALAVEVPGHASQFDLAVQRLVRYA